MSKGKVLPLAEVINGIDSRNGIKLARIKRFNILLFAIVIFYYSSLYMIIPEPVVELSVVDVTLK